ncbi:TIM-barrel domain-containing protein [Actinosynnema sp. NPDC091369]
MHVRDCGDALERRANGVTPHVGAWGPDTVRVRVRARTGGQGLDALTPRLPATAGRRTFVRNGDGAELPAHFRWSGPRSAAGVPSQYTDTTGHPPEPPWWVTGFRQCRRRYRTQDELPGVTREHRRRGLPLSVIVRDFVHRTRTGREHADGRAVTVAAPVERIPRFVRNGARPPSPEESA